MRVLLLNTSFPPQVRSAGRLFHELGRDLVERGHSVTVITEAPFRRLSGGSGGRARGLAGREQVDGMTVLRVKGFPFTEGNLLGRGVNALVLPLVFLAAALRAGRHDATLIYSPPLTLGLVGVALRLIRGTPFAFNVQDIYPQTLVELRLIRNRGLIAFFEAIERLSYARSSKVVVHSDGNRGYLMERRGVPPGSIETIPNWVDVDAITPGPVNGDFRRRHGIGDEFVVTYAGTMGYAQDLTAATGAARMLLERTDIVWLLVGEGVRRRHWETAADGLRSVRFLPLLPPDEYADLLQASNAGLVPLTSDLRTPVVPGKLLDWMAAGRPVILTANSDGDAAAIVAEAGCGYTSAPDDASAIVDAVSTLAARPDLCEAKGSAGRSYAQKHFSKQSACSAYERLLLEITEGADPR